MNNLQKNNKLIKKIQADIKNSCANKTIVEKRNIISQFLTENAYIITAELDSKVYYNYLNYLIINALDGLINNSRPFIINQNYGQEYNRIFSNMNYRVYDVYFSDKIKRPIDGYTKILEQHKELTFHGFKNLLTIENIQSMINSGDENFQAYLYLYNEDLFNDNYNSFVAGQNYLQEKKRQENIHKLNKAMQKDSSLNNYIKSIDQLFPSEDISNKKVSVFKKSRKEKLW